MPAPTPRKSAPSISPKVTPVRAPSDSGSFPTADAKLRAVYIRRVYRLAAKLKRRPTKQQLRQVARIRDDHCLRLFGNYAALIRAAGLRPQVRGKTASDISQDEILLDFYKAVQRLGHFPTVTEYLKHGGYSYNLIMKHFDTWRHIRLTLQDRTGDDLNSPRHPRLGPAPHSASHPIFDGASPLARISMYPKQDDRPVCGTVLNYRAMLHQPTNEQGVVLLFGMMAEELGFIIENVRTEYPDCEGKRRVGKDSWQRVRIEFEYLASRFDHPSVGCDLIVCWRNDRPTMKKEVIALEQVLADRRKLLVSEAPSLSEVVDGSEPTPAPPSPPLVPSA